MFGFSGHSRNSHQFFFTEHVHKRRFSDIGIPDYAHCGDGFVQIIQILIFQMMLMSQSFKDFEDTLTVGNLPGILKFSIDLILQIFVNLDLFFLGTKEHMLDIFGVQKCTPYFSDLLTEQVTLIDNEDISFIGAHFFHVFFNILATEEPNVPSIHNLHYDVRSFDHSP